MQLAMDAQGYDKATAKQRYTGNGVDTSAVYDEQGRRFDRLRGSNSLVASLRDFVSKVGGDYNLISKWAEDQAGNSWNPRAQAFKYHIVQNLVSKAESLFWWRDGKAAAQGHYQKYAKDPLVFHRRLLKPCMPLPRSCSPGWIFPTRKMIVLSCLGPKIRRF
jgi:hypothetical protein